MATLYAYSPNGTQATLSYSVIGFTQSLAQNGWCKLPNGLILQWQFHQNVTIRHNGFSSFFLTPNISMEFFIALGMTEDVNAMDDGIITETNNFSAFTLNNYPTLVSIFYIGY